MPSALLVAVTRAAPKAFSGEARGPADRRAAQRPDRGTAALAASDYAVIAIVAVTGLRATELRELNIGDLEGSPTERHLAVRHGKGDKTRLVPIGPRLETVYDAPT